MKTISLLWFFCLSLGAFAQSIYFVPETNKKGKVGLYHRGQLVLEHKYEMILSTDKRVLTMKDDHYSFYNEDFELIHEGDYRELIDFQDSWVVLLKDKRIIVLDSLFQPTSAFSDQMKAGELGILSNRAGLYGMVDDSFNLVVPFEYKMIQKQDLMANHPVYFFSKEDNASGPFGIINKEGNVLIEGKYQKIERLKAGMSMFFLLWERENQAKLAILSEDGLTIKVKEEYTIANLANPKSKNGKARFELQDGRIILCDTAGNISEDKDH